jgi:hypothetical protein
MKLELTNQPLRRIIVGLVALLWVQAAKAQAIRAPSFFIEPGVVTINSISAPLPNGSATGVNLRFLANFPTAISWLTLEVGTSFAPFGLSNGLRAFNEPTFFYGPIVMLLPRDRTANWLELTMPVLGAYRLDENGEADRLYVHDLVLQGALAVPLGSKLMADMGSFWSRVSLYGIIEQNLTPARDFNTRQIDRFNPKFLYGISVPIRGAARRNAEP